MNGKKFDIENVSDFDQKAQAEIKKIWKGLSYQQQLYLNEILKGSTKAQAKQAAGYNQEPRGKELLKAVNIVSEMNLEVSLNIRQEKINQCRAIQKKLLKLLESTSLTVNGEIKAADLLRNLALFSQMENNLLGINKPQEKVESEGLTDDENKDLSSNINDSCPD